MNHYAQFVAWVIVALGFTLGAYDTWRLAKGHSAVSKFTVFAAGIILGVFQVIGVLWLFALAVGWAVGCLLLSFIVKPIPSRASLFY